MDGQRQFIYRHDHPAEGNSFFEQMKGYFSKMAGTEGYEVVDMQPAFLRDFQMYEENFEFQCDGHWNELAHFLAASAIVQSQTFENTFGIGTLQLGRRP